MVGYTGAPRIVAISLLKACISLTASLDRTLQHLTMSDTKNNYYSSVTSHTAAAMESVKIMTRSKNQHLRRHRQ